MNDFECDDGLWKITEINSIMNKILLWLNKGFHLSLTVAVLQAKKFDKNEPKAQSKI